VRSAGVKHQVVTRAQLEDALDALGSEAASRVCMVSGSPGFIKTVRRVLRTHGVRALQTDSFIGY
jgi:NAD(P)H-flavin reductase